MQYECRLFENIQHNTDMLIVPDMHDTLRLQSAYKRFHSTETALLKIHNDIICNMDNGKVTALTLLDLSAAFDTIDHAILLERLYGHFGISGTVLQWFKSYISNRQQRVHIDGSLSCPQDLNFGVPQGSVLGHFL